MSKVDDERIAGLLKDAPLGDPSPELRERLRTSAERTHVRRPNPWLGRAVLAGAGLATIVGIATLTMTPLRAEAKTFEKVVQAAERADSFQFSVTSLEGGTTHRVVIAAADGKFGIRADDGALMQIDGSKMEIYDPKENTVTSMSLSGIVDPKLLLNGLRQGISDGLKEIDLKAMLHDYEMRYGKENIHVGPITHAFGRSSYEVSLQKPGENERVTMTVDADTDLPGRILVEKQTDGQWKQDAQIEVSFGRGVDVDLANSRFPANAKRVELDLGKMIEGGLKGLDFDLHKGK